MANFTYALVKVYYEGIGYDLSMWRWRWYGAPAWCPDDRRDLKNAEGLRIKSIKIEIGARE